MEELTSAHIAAQWRLNATIPYTWRRAENQAGSVPGMSKGYYVHCPELPRRRAYLKPVSRVGTVAAREKIAADLAHDLGVRVPPVILATMRETAESVEQHVCVSLVQYPSQHSWATMDPIPGIYYKPAVSKFIDLSLDGAAKALAFDTWVDQPDHGEDVPNHNIVVGYDPHDEGSGAVVFLDYSMALGFSGVWENEGHLRCNRSAFPRYLLKNVPPATVLEAVEQIEKFPVGIIEEVIGRIPESHLSQSEGALIARGLIKRRELLRQALASHIRGAA